MFSISSYKRRKLSVAANPANNHNPPKLKPANTSEVADALTRAVLHDEKRLVHDADLIIGRVTAARLVEHLRGAGFEIVKSGDDTTPGRFASSR
jgi:hypothetical protein